MSESNQNQNPFYVYYMMREGDKLSIVKTDSTSPDADLLTVYNDQSLSRSDSDFDLEKIKVISTLSWAWERCNEEQVELFNEKTKGLVA